MVFSFNIDTPPLLITYMPATVLCRCLVFSPKVTFISIVQIRNARL